MGDGLECAKNSITYLKNLNGYDGYIIDCKSEMGYPANLMVFIHPLYEDLLYIDIEYDKSVGDTALEILKSFTPVE